MKMSRASSELSILRSSIKLINLRLNSFDCVFMAGYSFFFPQELGFEEGQSVLLLEKFSTVQAVLASCSDAARGKITCTYFTKRASIHWRGVMYRIGYMLKEMHSLFSIYSIDEVLFVLQFGAKIHQFCNRGR